MKSIHLSFVRSGLFGLLLALGTHAAAERTVLPLNNDWTFRFNHQVQKNAGQRVDLPHTWNAQDALAGEQDYLRGTGCYTKRLFVDNAWQGKRIYLKLDGANSVADVFVNEHHVGEHRGGYEACVFELTDFVDYGKENVVLVCVSNSHRLDVMPLVGDFNFYGGIYRDASLIVADPVGISLTDCASPGVRLEQDSVSHQHADVTALVTVTNGSGKATPVRVAADLLADGKMLQSVSVDVTLPAHADSTLRLPIAIEKPHLWNGRKDPYRYQVRTRVAADGMTEDAVTQPLGLRYYSIDPDKGFFLNGEHLALHGVCRHQDRIERGNALLPEHHEQDAALMAEMGVNAVRLAHYPQSGYFYELMDRYGIIVWAEIPFVGPGGYQDRGFVNTPEFRANGVQQLQEMIRQNFNHPSICFWGLYNELKTVGDDPTEYLKELNAVAHREDPTRLTTGASCLAIDNTLSPVPDLQGWNHYYGWYGGNADGLGVWLDKIHAQYPDYRLGISEYGAGASIYHQQDTIGRVEPTGWWHPENYQTYCHIHNWRALSTRPFVWGSFVWNMFDFGAAHRTEGDRPGINDKGLVTFDRRVRKDAYYFYKANWNKEEPMVYIAARRNRERTNAQTDIMVFSNQPEVELLVNGKSLGKVKTDDLCIAEWHGVALSQGDNRVEAVAGDRKSRVADEVCFTLR
jgi:beta-galactosidase